MVGQIPHREALIAEHEQVCENFRALAEIRFKLLGFLPVSTAAGLFLVESDKAVSLPISALGCVATIAFWIYNARNDQLYDELVGRAAELEERLDLPDGSFATRPGTWLRPFRIPIEHGLPVRLLYGSSLTAWLASLFYTSWLRLDELGVLTWGWAVSAGPFLFLTAVAAVASALFMVAIAVHLISKSRSEREEEMRELAVRTVAGLSQPASSKRDNERKQLIHDLACLRSSKPNQRLLDDTKSRLLYFAQAQVELDQLQETADKQRAAAWIVAKVADCSPRWVLDCSTGRRRARRATAPAEPVPAEAAPAS